jgi:hypothetical protein
MACDASAAKKRVADSLRSEDCTILLDGGRMVDRWR